MMLFKRIPVATAAVIVIGGLSLSACQSPGDIWDAIFTKGAGFYDDVLQGAIDVKCLGASGGSITRRYMQTPEGWKMWTDECLSGGGKIIPVLPTEPKELNKIPAFKKAPAE